MCHTLPTSCVTHCPHHASHTVDIMCHTLSTSCVTHCPLNVSHTAHIMRHTLPPHHACLTHCPHHASHTAHIVRHSLPTSCVTHCPHNESRTVYIMSLYCIVGIMVTSKKRHEFRIQLLKRARRRALKKIEHLEDDKSWKEVQFS